MFEATFFNSSYKLAKTPCLVFGKILAPCCSFRNVEWVQTALDWIRLFDCVRFVVGLAFLPLPTLPFWLALLAQMLCAADVCDCTHFFRLCRATPLMRRCFVASLHQYPFFIRVASILGDGMARRDPAGCPSKSVACPAHGYSTQFWLQNLYAVCRHLRAASMNRNRSNTVFEPV